MTEYCITKEDIKKWLFSYQPSEKKLEEYYKKHHKLIGMDEFMENKKQYFDISKCLYVYTNLRCIRPKVQISHNKYDFIEEEWFPPFWDVSLHRHPRFYPEFLHAHEFFELCYMLSGNCQHTLFISGKGETWNQESGDVIIIPPGVKHSIKMNSDSVAVNILIRRSTFENIFLHSIPMETLLFKYFVDVLHAEKAQKYLLFHTGEDAQLQDLFLEMAYEYCNRSKSKGDIINLQLSIFFARILRDYYDTIDLRGHVYEIEEKIPAILQYMEINFANMTINEIAEHFHFSGSYLRKRFKESTGQTLVVALQQIRVSKAVELLEKTDISVEKISLMIGYEDTTHFIRLFKRTIGVTPAQYRNSRSGQSG